MSISCDCSSDYGDKPEFYSETFPVAKKEYTCCECGETIKHGQVYNRFTGKWDGKVTTYKTCMPCYNIREHYCPNGYVFGDLAVQIGDCLGFDYRHTPGEDDEDDGEE